MLRLRQNAQTVSVIWEDATGKPHQLASTNLSTYNITLVHNVRRHWIVKLSNTLLTINIDGKQVLSTAVNIPWNVGYIMWNGFSYNTTKENVVDTLLHWDNFGFDAPVGNSAPDIVRNYRTVPYDGSEYTLLTNAVHTTTVPIPDSIAGATSARLMFTLQNGGGANYAWASTDKVSVNGQAFSIPQPTDGYQTGNMLVTVNCTYSVSISIPPSILVAGNNSVSYSLHLSGVLNTHIEVNSPAGTPAPYTQPSAIMALMGIDWFGYPTMSVVGLSLVITTFNGVDTWPWMNGTPAQSALKVQNVSGKIPLTVTVTGDIALHSTGKQVGCVRVDLLIDGVIIQSQLTNNVVPAVGGVYAFTIDTTKLSNGKHSVMAQATSTAGALSIPDYFQCEQTMNGAQDPIMINVANPIVPVTSNP